MRSASRHYKDDDEGARLLARKLAAYTRGDIAVLARTVNALRPYALAAAAAGVAISRTRRAIRAARGAGDARGLLRRVERSGAGERSRRTRDPAAPSRGLGADAAKRICAGLHRGLELPAAVEALPAPADARWRVARATEKLAALAGITDAAGFVARLRRDGLDRHFEQAQEASARPDRDDLQALAEAEAEAKGHSLHSTRRCSLSATNNCMPRATRSTGSSSRLSTAPRVANGRASSSSAPTKALCHTHMRSKPAHASGGRRGARGRTTNRVRGVHARAGRALDTPHQRSTQPFPHRSRTRREPAAALTGESKRAASAGFWHDVTRPAADSRKPEIPPVSTREHLERARQIGLHHVLSMIADRAVALDVATLAVAVGQIGPATRSEKLTVRRLLGAIAALTESEREEVRRSVAALGWTTGSPNCPTASGTRWPRRSGAYLASADHGRDQLRRARARDESPGVPRCGLRIPLQLSEVMV